jgi:FkbM family methyltransferase
MKLKHILQLIGFRGKPRRYGYSVEEFPLEGHGIVKYAQWQHPKETPKTISMEAVRQYRKFINEGDLCVDIGAHTGDSTIPIALAAGNSGLTLALEPNPYVFPVLEKNTRLNRARASIIPLMAAAVEHEGEVMFEYSDSGYCNGGCHAGIKAWKHGHTFKLAVQGINLSQELRDHFGDFLPRLKFIKVDAEGYDLHVINAIADLIDEFHPYVKAEVFKYASAEYRADLIRFFADRGYRVHKIATEPCKPGEIVNPADASRWSHYDIFCVPPHAVQQMRLAG